MYILSFKVGCLFLVCFVDVKLNANTDVKSAKDICTSEQISFIEPPHVCKRIVRPALTKSIFPNIPPTINFVPEGEEVDQLPWRYRKLLKWKLTIWTDVLMKECLSRNGFNISKDVDEWLGGYDNSFRRRAFVTLKDYQKLNFFPGTLLIKSKDQIVLQLSRMQLLYGTREFGFFPKSYVVPKDLPDIQRAFKEGGPDQRWIIKPPSASQGNGIKVISEVTEIPEEKNWVVQRYIANPYLINDLKFDLRIYVYVTSFDPLRIYVFDDGLARFATVKYSTSTDGLKNNFIHLTNYAVNKHNKVFRVNDSDTANQGHKWSLTALWNYLERQGINTALIWDKIVDIIVKTLISVDENVNKLTKANNVSRYSMYELFGYDILLDEKLDPWLLEVNTMPSLLGASNLTRKMNSRLVMDLLNTAGFRIPDEDDLNNETPEKLGPRDLRSYSPPNKVCNDKRLFNQMLSENEKDKHNFYTNRHHDKHDMQGILDTLTPDDVRILTETIDEESRSAGFIRIFPTPFTHKYLKYFDTPRYYNLLLDQWIQQYDQTEEKGIALLQSLCERRVHLNLHKNSHKWISPNTLQ